MGNLGALAPTIAGLYYSTTPVKPTESVSLSSLSVQEPLPLGPILAIRQTRSIFHQTHRQPHDDLSLLERMQDAVWQALAVSSEFPIGSVFH